jgi:hypothetical protein
MGVQGRIQDFKLGEAQLKKLRRAEGSAKIFGVFRVKNHDFTPKIHIFSNFKGGAPGAHPPWIRPWCLCSWGHRVITQRAHALRRHCLVVIFHCFMLQQNETKSVYMNPFDILLRRPWMICQSSRVKSISALRYFPIYFI